MISAKPGWCLLRESMSEAGYRSARDVMRLNEHALEITGKPEEYSEWFYWVSIFGDPSPNEPWGWQIDGHHLNLNCFVLGDQLVMTPAFMGSEPVLARFGKYAGTRVFAAEEEQGHALMRALSSEERRRATVGKDLPSELLTAAFRDNQRIDASAFAMAICRWKDASISNHCWGFILAGCGLGMPMCDMPRRSVTWAIRCSPGSVRSMMRARSTIAS